MGSAFYSDIYERGFPVAIEPELLQGPRISVGEVFSTDTEMKVLVV
jgi:hypothetical protein